MQKKRLHGTKNTNFAKQNPVKKNPVRQPRQLKGQASAPKPTAAAIKLPADAVMIWGKHAVFEALGNKRRKIIRLYLAPDMIEAVGERYNTKAIETTSMSKADMTNALKAQSRDDSLVHQGIVAIARPLHQPNLDDWLDNLTPSRQVVILLDQITDARNIGAIMRSARAFNAAAIIATDKHCPDETGHMLRAASGAMEHLPLIKVVNLARAIENLQSHGFTIAGMAADGTDSLPELVSFERLGIIMGAEGKGLRRLSREHADMLVRIPINGDAESLNVSNAAAVALYAAQRPLDE